MQGPVLDPQHMLFFIFLPPLLSSLPPSFFVVLGMKPRGLFLLGKCTTKLHCKPPACYLKCPLKVLYASNCQQGIESIDQIASLCQSDLEAVRAAAREATLSFGKVVHHVSSSVVGPRGS